MTDFQAFVADYPDGFLGVEHVQITVEEKDGKVKLSIWLSSVRSLRESVDKSIKKWVVSEISLHARWNPILNQTQPLPFLDVLFIHLLLH